MPRFVLVSAFGVGQTKAKASGLARFIYSTLVKKLFADKAIAEAAVLPGLKVNWTAVYPVNLKGGPAVQSTLMPVEGVTRVPGLPTLSYATVGAALVGAAADDSLGGRKLLLTTAKGWR